MAMPSPTTTRVIICLPYNRPDEPLEDPPQVEWNAEKAALLWEVIARSKASENARTDWDGLAAHLQVPLPYLLYRAQMRYEEGLRGLHGRRALNASNIPSSPKGGDELVLTGQKPSLTLKISNRVTSQNGPTSSSTRLSSPLAVRARLNSLGSRSARSPIIPSSSTSTLQGHKKSVNPVPIPPSPSPPDSSDSEDDDVRKAEEFEKQEALAKRLSELQRVMTKENLGLVRSPQSPKGKEIDRGRAAAINSRPVSGILQRDELSSRSQSASSANSPQNSVPSMPSPPLDSQRGSPTGKPPSSNSSSPPPSSTRGQSHLRFGHLVLPHNTGEHVSELGSTHGTSSASSFSDISDASISPSTLDSTNTSNAPALGNRMSTFARSRFSGRGRGVRL